MTGAMIVSQLGARMHYAVPRILHHERRLERFFTDACASRGWPRLVAALPRTVLPAPARRLAGRRPSLPVDRVTSYAGLGLSFALRLARARTPTERTAAHLWAGGALCRKVVRRLETDGFGQAKGVFGYSGECLELLEAARTSGRGAAVEQIIAPRAVLDALMEEEFEAFPDWSRSREPDALAVEYADRERAEWRAADIVLCGSDFVREGVIAEGGEPSKCVVVPYGVTAHPMTTPIRRRPGQLRVLTVGTVGLRKGAPYVLEAARRLAGRAVFRLVGAIDVSPIAAARLVETVELVGSVPRMELARHFEWADVFLLPSICEGSATVIYEALAAGLPVVATPNAGGVARHGIDGFVVPIRDADEIAAALDRLACDRQLLGEMSRNAHDRASDFDLEHYGDRLLQALDRSRPDASRSAAAPGPCVVPA